MIPPLLWRSIDCVCQADQSVLYAFGNQSRGQLGIPPASMMGDRPSQSFTSRAAVVSPEGISVKQMAIGFEHVLTLTGQLIFGWFPSMIIS